MVQPDLPGRKGGGVTGSVAKNSVAATVTEFLYLGFPNKVKLSLYFKNPCFVRIRSTRQAQKSMTATGNTKMSGKRI